MLFFLFSKYILIEEEVEKPKTVVTYYMSPLCKPCFKFHKNPRASKDTMIVYHPVLMGDHDETLQVFVLSLIKKFRFVKFWEISERFYHLEQDPALTPDEIADRLGFSKEEITWMKTHISYQEMIREELRNPVQARIVGGFIEYIPMKEEDISYVPMLKTTS